MIQYDIESKHRAKLENTDILLRYIILCNKSILVYRVSLTHIVTELQMNTSNNLE